MDQPRCGAHLVTEVDGPIAAHYNLIGWRTQCVSYHMARDRSSWTWDTHYIMLFLCPYFLADLLEYDRMRVERDFIDLIAHRRECRNPELTSYPFDKS